MVPITLVPRHEFDRVRAAALPEDVRLRLIADMCRANAAAMVKRAGSGHLGTTFSAMDIVVALYFREMNTAGVGWDHPDRDVYFSSKGHDVPGLYAVLHALGHLPTERFIRLRRLGGVDGHPDVGVPGIEANSGSLGMGISKGRGFAWAKRHAGRGGRVYVMTGDGEFQEGQNFEALQSTVQQGIDGLTVIIDHNKVQSDRPVADIVDLGDLETKLRSFGWHVVRCDGHDHAALHRAIAECRGVRGRPQIIVADTVKGCGVSFMEHPRALADGGGYYKWHAGAPDDDSFLRAHMELLDRANCVLAGAGLRPLDLEEVEPLDGSAPGNALGEPKSRGEAQASLKARAEYVVEAYGEELVAIGHRRSDVVVLDADLAADCRTRTFELAFPGRFIQNGIAEQDMVSMAGGLARSGLLPIVNSFASFLASRANEQIYTNAGERTHIVYACHYAGLIPAGPGKSHQSLRDVSLLTAIPGATVLQPCNAEETRQALRWCVDEARGVCVLRLAIGPSPRRIELPPGYRLTPGCGAILRRGRGVAMIACGPVMLHEVLGAAELLEPQGVNVTVAAFPWMNRIDRDWLRDVLQTIERLYVVEDHSPVGGLGDLFAGHLLNGPAGMPALARLGVDGWPACGTPAEALRQHGLDAASLAARVLADLGRPGA